MFKIDENLPEEVGAILRTRDFDVATVRSQGLCGCPDPSLADICRRESRTMVTQDLGFVADYRLAAQSHAGLIVFRPHHPTRSALLRLASDLGERLPRASLRGQVWIVRDGRIRVHGPPR